jgi:hypothetical protein
MTTINLNNIGKVSQKRIRDDNGVKTITSLINLAKEKGVNVGVKKETQQKRAYEYFGNILNNKIEAEREKKIRAEQKKKDDDKKKRKEEKRKKKEIQNVKKNVFEIIDGDITIINQLYEIVKQNKPFKVTLIGDMELVSEGEYTQTELDAMMKKNTKILKQKDYDFRGKKLADAFTELHHDYLIESPDIYYWDKLATRVFVTFGDKPVKTNKIIQAFFDGKLNCVMTPIIHFIEEKIKTAESDKTKANHKSRLNKALSLEKKYHDTGVNEQALNEISNELQLDLYIDLPFQKNYLVSKSNKKAFRTFHFVNTRLNHVDFSEITHTDNIIEVSLDELKAEQDSLDKYKQFYTYTKNCRSINSITTLDAYFVLKNDYKNAVYEFECETGLMNIKLDDVTQNEVSKFVRQGCHFNETVQVNDQSEEYYHIDMQKAYINYKTCKYYDGFVGKITDFRKCDKIMGIGYYQIKNLVLNGKLKQMNEYLEAFRYR